MTLPYFNIEHRGDAFGKFLALKKRKLKLLTHAMLRNMRGIGSNERSIHMSLQLQRFEAESIPKCFTKPPIIEVELIFCLTLDRLFVLLESLFLGLPREREQLFQEPFPLSPWIEIGIFLMTASSEFSVIFLD